MSPSHKTPRPTRGHPMITGQRPRPLPAGHQGVNQLGTPPRPAPPPMRVPNPVSQPRAHAHNLGPPINNRSLPMRRVDDPPESLWALEPGEYYFTVDEQGVTWCALCLPTASGEKSSARIPVKPLPTSPVPKPWRKNAAGDWIPWPVWAWNGNEERPTFTPSIRHGDSTDDYYWHGYVTDGHLVGCQNERKPIA